MDSVTVNWRVRQASEFPSALPDHSVRVTSGSLYLQCPGESEPKKDGEGLFPWGSLYPSLSSHSTLLEEP